MLRNNSIPDVLAYEAPFLIEKLLKDHIVETADEARTLFTEVKRYIAASQAGFDEAKRWDMYSLRIDEVWHQFVLFTREYTDFTKQFFGKYIHHNPANAPKYETDEPWPEPMPFPQFVASYEKFFGIALPDVWYDERSVTPHRRVSRDAACGFEIRRNNGVVEVLSHTGELLLSVTDIAAAALEFIKRTPTFYVRELPGDLTDDEKVGLIATLVEYRLLRVAP